MYVKITMRDKRFKLRVVLVLILLVLPMITTGTASRENKHLFVRVTSFEQTDCIYNSEINRTRFYVKMSIEIWNNDTKIHSIQSADTGLLRGYGWANITKNANMTVDINQGGGEMPASLDIHPGLTFRSVGGGINIYPGNYSIFPDGYYYLYITPDEPILNTLGVNIFVDRGNTTIIYDTVPLNWGSSSYLLTTSEPSSGSGSSTSKSSESIFLSPFPFSFFLLAIYSISVYHKYRK